MRHLVVPAVVLAAMAQRAYAGHRVPRPRSVEVIAMGIAARAAAPAPTVSLDPAASPDRGIRVHDLRRRWIEDQLEASYRADGVGPQSQTNDPLRDSGVSPVLGAGPTAIGRVSPVSAIVPPQWMASGAGFGMPPPFLSGCGGASYSPSGLLSLTGEERRRGYFAMMSSIACEFGVPVSLFDALIIRESQYQPEVYSPKLAYGLTQLMPDTARALGVNRYDPVENLRGGARYLRSQLDRFGQYHLALAAYNAGPGRVRGGQIPDIPETQAYVSNVIANWSRLNGWSAAPFGLNSAHAASVGADPDARRRRQVLLAIF